MYSPENRKLHSVGVVGMNNWIHTFVDMGSEDPHWWEQIVISSFILYDI